MARTLRLTVPIITALALRYVEDHVLKAQRADANRITEQAIRRLHLEMVQAQLENDVAALDRV